MARPPIACIHPWNSISYKSIQARAPAENRTDCRSRSSASPSDTRDVCLRSCCSLLCERASHVSSTVSQAKSNKLSTASPLPR